MDKVDSLSYAGKSHSLGIHIDEWDVTSLGQAGVRRKGSVPAPAYSASIG
ncbi:hypothetical protein AB0K52_11730 [Glycomyces sp. NPDC049804]